MDSLDPTERALAERVEIRRQQLREAEEGLELYRRDVEMQRQIALDHALALTLQDAEDPERPLQWRLRIDDEEDEEDDDESTLSDLIDEVVVRNDPNQRTCVTCLDDLSDQDAHRCPCRHDWCQTCIVNRYEMAARSTHLFPAQCCNQPILPDNHELVAPETWARYFEKKTEVETPNPTFCSKRDCSKFIPLRDIIEGRAKCVCEHVTCTSCKAEWHDGECVVDPETEQVLSLAREQQWQTCFHCREMVVRRDGCNEMECRCGRTFCYACGLEWKTCLCPQFGRAEPADQQAARPWGEWGWGVPPVTAGWGPIEPVEPGVPVVPIEVDNPGVPVEETPADETAPTANTRIGFVISVGSTFSGITFREMLEANRRPRRASTTSSGCVHSWRRIGGGGTCQTCNTDMPNFLFQCRTCRHTSCYRCRQGAGEAR